MEFGSLITLCTQFPISLCKVHGNHIGNKMLWKKREYLKFSNLCVFSPPLQEAIKHNSFFEPQRRLERGNVDEAFETVDQILEGKVQNVLGGWREVYESFCQFEV